MDYCILNLVAKAEQDALVVRYRTKQIAALAELTKLDRSKLVTATSEILRNSIKYAGNAKVCYRIVEQSNFQYLEVTVSDSGTGVEDLQSVLMEPGRGGGITASRQLVDQFLIDSGNGEGTSVVLRKKLTTRKRVSQADVDKWIEQLKNNSPFSVVDDLEQQNKQLLDSLAEIEKYKERLEERTRQLKKANQYKGEFLANMSHEIRTPMNAILGMSNILDRSELNNDQRKYVSLIKDAGQSLLSIINDILDFSKIEAGKIEIEHIEFDPGDLVEATAELLATNATAKKLSLMSWLSPGLPSRVHGDPTRLKQVLVNLANNAIKFTESGEIVIKTSVKATEEESVVLRFEVIDSGIGLTDEQQGKLFKPFIQADGSTTRKYGGTGLGLSICKQLTELMGGTIGVDSVKGKGSTFWLDLPFPLATASEPLEQEKVAFESALIVDDHPFTRQLMSGQLEDWGIKCESRISAEEALVHLESRPEVEYDLMILDYMMPGRNGIELVKEIRKREINSKIVLLTAFDEEELGQKSIDAGANAFLTKPLRQSHLHCCLDSLLNPQKREEKEKAVGQSHSRTKSVELVQSGKEVLLVEDNPTNQMVASIELKDRGLNVTVAKNGAEAVERLSSVKFDLVFMDCQMPVLDGYEATRQIRNQEARTGHHVPIVAMTANAMAGDREKCIEAGMDDYITKPFEPQTLTAIIEKWLLIKTNESQSNGEEQTNEKSLDLEQLQQRFGVGQAKALVDVFLTDTKKRLKEIEKAGPNDCELLSKQAHAIKGAASMIYAQKLTDAARKLEMAAKSENTSEIDHLSAELVREFESFETYASALEYEG